MLEQTTTDQEFLRTWERVRTLKELARELNTTVYEVHQTWKRLNDAGHDLPRKPWSMARHNFTEEEFLNAWNSSHSREEVAQKLGCRGTDVASMHSRMRNYGFKLPRLSKPPKQFDPKIQDALGALADTKIGAQAGVTRERVRQWRERLGIPKRTVVVAALQECDTWVDAVDRTGLSVEQLGVKARVLRENGMEFPGKPWTTN